MYNRIPFYDIANNRWLTAEIPGSEFFVRTRPGTSVDLGLAYDAERDLVWGVMCKLRGNGADMQKYVYSKIYNAKAYNLCSEMPRFGHIEAIGPDQIKDLVALLLDPESPVNK